MRKWRMGPRPSKLHHLMVLLAVLAAGELKCQASSQFVWHQLNSPTSTTLIGAACGTQGCVSVGSGGTLLNSPNGVDWTLGNSGVANVLQGVGLNNLGNYIAVGYAGTLLLSGDTVHWSPQNSGTARFLSDVASGNGRTIICGDDGLLLRPPSYTAAWENANNSGVTWDLYAINFGVAGFVAVGQNGTILVGGLTGDHWISVTPIVPVHLLDVAFGADQYVAVGESGTILHSANGVAWFQAQSGTTARFKTVSYGDGFFIAGGEQGTLVRSTNAVDWQPEESGSTTDLVGSCYGKGQFLFVGSDGMLLAGTHPMPPRLSAARVAGEQKVRVVVTGTTGDTFHLEESTTFAAWNEIGAYTNQTGTLELTLPMSTATQREYYRTKR